MQADCETQKSVPTVRWGFPWQPQQREDTGLPSLPSSLPLSLSVSRVIKDCTLINFFALSRAKCPGRGPCVWPLCVCAHVSVCVLRGLLCMRPWFLNTFLSSIQQFSHLHSNVKVRVCVCVCVSVCVCLSESNTIFPLTFCFRPFSVLNLTSELCPPTHPPDFDS